MTRVLIWILAGLLIPLAAWHAAPAPASDRAEDQPSRLAELLGSEADAAFARVREPRPFTFPADHGPHPEYRNEWWYFTGNLDGEQGRRFGFELTFFRFALAPSIPDTNSAWRTNQVYIAHLALTDAGSEGFYVEQRYARSAAGLAGARAEPFRVWLGDWEVSAAEGSSEWRLIAHEGKFGIDLRLAPIRPPVLHGADGLSQKSAQPGNASYYYSITRLETRGTVRVGEAEHRVSGLSWFDREWSTSALEPGQAGWDWFALQLSDGTDLMFYKLRKKGGAGDPASAGTWVDADGIASHLAHEDVLIDVLERWKSPEGGTYPARWRLRVPRLDLDVTVTPVIADQELSTTVRYWEGAVDVNGVRDGEPLTGRGYVELTGYAPQSSSESAGR